MVSCLKVKGGQKSSRRVGVEGDTDHRNSDPEETK